MRIEHVRLVNYKGFRDSSEIALGAKFTILVGQNNAGKTAFLEGLTTTAGFENKPFREPQAPGSFPAVPNPESSTIVGVSVTGEELKWWMLGTGVQFNIPVVGSSDSSYVEAQIHKFFKSPEMKFTARFIPGTGWSSVPQPSVTLAGAPNWNALVTPRGDRQDIEMIFNQGVSDTVVQHLVGPYVTAALYVFRAERMNVAECPIEGGVELRPNANNLASVLLQLDGDPAAQERFIKYLRTIFPTIYSVISRPRLDSPSTARIEVINRSEQRPEWRTGVSVPLSDSGTGISQVLAILYVVVTAQTPRVIVVDEPNSFLHPGAAKKLLAILKESDHQYIITTHSSDIVRAIDPDVLHLVKWSGRESVIETINSSDVKDIRKVLGELEHFPLGLNRGGFPKSCQ